MHETARLTPVEPLPASRRLISSPASSTMEPITLLVADAAPALGVSQSTIGQLAREGSLPSLRVGRRQLIPIDALKAWPTAKHASSPTKYTAMR